MVIRTIAVEQSRNEASKGEGPMRMDSTEMADLMRVMMVGATVLLSLVQAHAKTSLEKQAVIGWVKQNLRDPSSIRGARVTEPVPFGKDMTLVCVEMNAKNGFGGYTGPERHPFVFKAGQVIGPNQYYSARVNVTTSTCEGALTLEWRTFPELERL